MTGNYETMNGVEMKNSIILLVKETLEDENDDSLDGIADRKQIEEHHRRLTNGKSAEYPCDPQEAQERDGGTNTFLELNKSLDLLLA